MIKTRYKLTPRLKMVESSQPANLDKIEEVNILNQRRKRKEHYSIYPSLGGVDCSPSLERVTCGSSSIFAY